LVEIVGWLFLGVVLGPLAVLPFIPKITSGVLGVLVVPSTFAASLLLLRDPTTLGAALRRWATWALVGGLAVLWVIVLILYATHRVDT
jgi:hypothetical protein